MKKTILLFLIIIFPGIIYAQNISSILATGKEYYLSGEYKRAVDEFKTVAENEKSNPEEKHTAHLYLGICQLMLSDNTEPVVEEFYRAIQTFPEKEIDRDLFSYKVVELYLKAKEKYLADKAGQEAQEKIRQQKIAEQERKKQEEQRLASERELAAQMRLERERLEKIKKAEEEKKLAADREIYERLKFALRLETKGDALRKITLKENKIKLETFGEQSLLKVGLEKRNIFGVYLQGGEARVATAKKWGESNRAIGISANYYLISPGIFDYPSNPVFINSTLDALRFIPDMGKMGIKAWVDYKAAILLGLKGKTYSLYAGPGYTGIQSGNFKETNPLTAVIGIVSEQKYFSLKAEVQLLNKFSGSFGVGW